jgi:hypothetical protein
LVVVAQEVQPLAAPSEVRPLAEAARSGAEAKSPAAETNLPEAETFEAIVAAVSVSE